MSVKLEVGAGSVRRIQSHVVKYSTLGNGQSCPATTVAGSLQVLFPLHATVCSPPALTPYKPYSSLSSLLLILHASA